MFISPPEIGDGFHGDVFEWENKAQHERFNSAVFVYLTVSLHRFIGQPPKSEVQRVMKSAGVKKKERRVYRSEREKQNGRVCSPAAQKIITQPATA